MELIRRFLHFTDESALSEYGVSHTFQHLPSKLISKLPTSAMHLANKILPQISL